jgi:hypothetical protein
MFFDIKRLEFEKIKAEYMNKLPYTEPLQINEGTASWHYWNWIKETKRKSVLL